MKIVAVIPARMASTRFPGKILFPFHGLPMIEHVRRRALMAESPADVIVATCDLDIASIIHGYGGKVILTDNTHQNGSTRAAEAIKNVDCSHVILLQGDEPLLLPRHVDMVAKSIESDPDGFAWNATGLLEHPEELDKNSFVKCMIGNHDRILSCFRRSPCYSDFEVQKKFIRKMLGIIAFRKDFLLQLMDMPPTPIELTESIEQMRIIENGYSIRSVPVIPSLPSVNEKNETQIILDYMDQCSEQSLILNKIVTFEKNS
jgi:3-deoxy-manno-octulosonate cytidylyltransferase (CMP-KDO synthetase)